MEDKIKKGLVKLTVIKNDVESPKFENKSEDYIEKLLEQLKDLY